MILPSLLSADVLNLENEIKSLCIAKASMIHLDVMDQHYVPNLTFGPMFCAAIRKKFPHLGIDVHLMTNRVHELITEFTKAGATRVSIHPDACIHLDRELEFIHDQGAKVGLVLNPSTSIDCLEYIHQRLNFVLIMTVNPGFGGQKLIPSCLEKIKKIRKIYPNLSISVDGGVNLDTIKSLSLAGADDFIVGAGLFGAENYAQRIHELTLLTQNNNLDA